tara:strand:- start:744 stop:1673 length:930 start_codon:yes stop_codon:yes gene_type:complete
MTSLVFPGQGSQYIGMAKDFYDEYVEVRQIFEEIEDSSKIKIKDIIFNDSSNLINITQFTQLAIFCSSISIYEIFKKYQKKINLNINYVLGHSLGEYTALVSSNIITINECSKLLKVRGELMQNSYKENFSGMVAIIGLDCQSVEKIILKNNLNIEVANDNSPLQVVISGIKKDLSEAEEIFLQHGIKRYQYLNVSAAFHSKIMKNAEKEMKTHLNKIQFKKPIYPIISNYDAKCSANPEIIFNNLSNQMSNKVKWVESIKCLESLKETNIIEIGPGKILTGLIKRISNKFTLSNINSIKDLENIINGL